MAQGVPLIVQKTNDNQADQVKKKGLPGNETKPGKSGKSSFAEIIEKAGKEGQFLHQFAEKANNGEMRLLRFISQIIKSIRDTLPASLKENLFTFIKKLVLYKGSSEKEKGDILKTLLQKIRKKGPFPASAASKIAALSSILDKNVSEKHTRDVPVKNKLLEGIRSLADEKAGKGTGPHEGASKLVVIDLRKGKTGKQLIEKAHIRDNSPGNTGENGNNTGTTIKLNTQEGTPDNFLYFSLKDGQGSQEHSRESGMVSKGNNGFDQQMMEKLKSTLQNEIVKHTKIILKENGNGEIRIVLKPESLGSIRMRVNLHNNHIDGRIFVENINIKEIVDQAVNNLNSAFRQEGFDSISLKVSVGHEQNQEQEDREQQGSAGYTHAEAVEEFEKNLGLLLDTDVNYSSVNLYV